jgi:hypothetical protein
MKKLFFLSFAVLLLFGACSKSDDETQLQTNAKIRFTSTSSNPYKISIDYVNKGTVTANSFTEIYVSPGTHIFQAEQLSGYIFYPNVTTLTHTCVAGIEFEFVFP